MRCVAPTACLRTERRRWPARRFCPTRRSLRFVSLLSARYPLAQVRLTGGEPLVRPKIETLVAMLRRPACADLALTTSGQQLAERARELKQAGLDRINISLDSLDPSTYAEITRGGVLSKTLAGIAAARQAGLQPVKLNMVVLRGMNDHEVADLVRFAMQHGCQMRFLELMPIGEAAAGFEERFVPSAEVRRGLAGKFSLTAHSLRSRRVPAGISWPRRTRARSTSSDSSRPTASHSAAAAGGCG